MADAAGDPYPGSDGELRPSPKYAQVRDGVLKLIADLSAGSPIPPERVLSERFGVSRVTLRRAVDDLVREGLLIRRQGSGTFVAADKITQRVSTTSFSENMRRRGLVPSSRVLRFGRGPAGARTARQLQISPTDEVVEFVRLRLADGEPMALETVAIPASLVPGLTPEDLARGSLYALLDERYGLRIVAVRQVIEPTVTSGNESSHLDQPLHAPALLVRTTARDGSGRVLEFARSLFRGDRYAIVTEVTAGPDGDAGIELSGVVTP
ncbi:MAG: GntR family transcriptional regulator, partial [Nitriliruptoraceae bacterium]